METINPEITRSGVIRELIDKINELVVELNELNEKK